MSRRKLFFENVFAYGFINVLNKIIPFLLLPVITRMLPNSSDFGIYSMYTTIIGFGTPLAVLGLYDAMFREYFEKEDLQYKYDVTTTTQRIIIFSSIVVSAVLILFSRNFSVLFFSDEGYINIVILASIGIFLNSVLNPIQAPTRMRNQRKVFVISGLISSFITYVLAVLLIYLGYSYYGLIYASAISTIALLIFFWVRNNAFFLKGTFNFKIAIELLKIGLPLLPTFLIYWVYNSMDKIMITSMLGTFSLGIYSVGSKVAQISQLIYAGFAGGWQYFAFSTMKDSDQVELNSKVFEYLGGLSILSLVFIYPFIPILFKALFTGDYVTGYIVTPYLYLSPLLLMLFQVVANQFIVVKKSYLATLSLTLGAITNVVLNFFLINRLGVEGAAIATLVGFLVTIVTVMIVSYRYKYMKYSKRILLLLWFIPIYIGVQRIYLFENVFMQFLFMFVTSIIILWMFKVELMSMFRKKVK